jgi:hypothetical protein
VYAASIITPKLDGRDQDKVGQTFGAIPNGSLVGQGGNEQAPAAATWLTLENRFPLPLAVGSIPVGAAGGSSAIAVPQTIPPLSRATVPVDPWADVAWQIISAKSGVRVHRAGARSCPYVLHDQGAPNCGPLYPFPEHTGSWATSDVFTFPTFTVPALAQNYCEVALYADRPVPTPGPDVRRITFQQTSRDACLMALHITLVDHPVASLPWSTLWVAPAYDYDEATATYQAAITSNLYQTPFADGLPKGSSGIIPCPGAWGVLLVNTGASTITLSCNAWVGVPAQVD